MGCNNFQTEQTDALVEASIGGENSGFSPETLERAMPQVREAKEARCVECLQENVENGRNKLTERLSREGREPTDIEKLDLEVIPTARECQEFYRAGREVGIPEWEIINMPVIMGINDTETLERIENIEERTKDLMGRLSTSKLSIRFRDIEVADRIMFIDKSETGVLGNVLVQWKFKEKPELPRVIHIYQDPATGKLAEGRRAQWVAIHEFAHLNLHKTEADDKPGEFARMFLSKVGDKLYPTQEWQEVCYKQLAGPGAASPEALKNFWNYPSKEEGFTDPEFIAEHIAMWDTGLAETCPEMNKFFQKHLSDE